MQNIDSGFCYLSDAIPLQSIQIHFHLNERILCLNEP